MSVGSAPAAQAFGVLGSVRMRVPQDQLRSAWEGTVRVVEGKDLVLGLILAGQPDSTLALGVNPASPDGDPGKFMINGKTARAIHHFSGWHVPISLGWFSGGYDQPVINGTAFYWYAFAIPERGMYRADHYFICDYLQMREWVLSFAAPRGNDHRYHASWRADLRLYPGEQAGYFRWGDEPVGVNEQPGRVFEVDNLLTIAMPPPAGQHVGGYGPGGESAAHKLLKLYVAGHPLEFGLSSAAVAHVEYLFATGDRVDVMFENHMPDRTVIEVEVEGEREVCVGIHQAIKYRSLAAADAGYPLLTSRVRSLVVAYSTEYSKARELADRYDIPLMSVNREKVLDGAR
jgi:hypothetical protein